MATTETVATAEPVVVGGTEVAAATGGMVGSDDGLLLVEIPAGALAEDIVVAVTRLERADWPEVLAGAEPLGAVYDLQPSGLTFAEPVKISRRITEAQTGLDFDTEVPLTLLLVVSDDETWEAPADQVVTRDGNDLLQVGTISHFSVTTLFGGAVTVKFTPTYVQPRKGEKFTTSVTLSLQRDVDVAVGVNWTPFSRDSVQAVSESGGGSLSPISDESLSFTREVAYECSTVGEGRYGVNIRAQETADEESRRIAAAAWQVPLDFVPRGALAASVSTAVITGTALCRDGAPPAGTQVRFTADFTSDNPEQCLGFDAGLVAVFGDTGDADGLLFFDYELEEGLPGRPFILTEDGTLVVEEFDVPSVEDQQNIESWVINPGPGTGTLTNQASGPGFDLTCIWNMLFDPIN